MQSLKLSQLIDQIENVRIGLDAQQYNAHFQSDDSNPNKALAFALFDNGGDNNTQFTQLNQLNQLGSKTSVIKAIEHFTTVLKSIHTKEQINQALETVKSNIDQITNVRYGAFPDNHDPVALKGKTFYDLLIAARDNYIKQLEAYNKVNALKESALEVTPYLHPKKNLARSIVSAVVGATVTGAVTYWLHKAFTTDATDAVTKVIPSTTVYDAVNHTSTITQPTTVTVQDAKPADGPNGSEAGLIALVCIIMLAITAYIAYHYYLRYKEDKDLDPSSNKNLLNIDGIDLDKSQSQIRTQRDEVARADFNIKKRLIDPPSLIQAF